MDINLLRITQLMSIVYELLNDEMMLSFLENANYQDHLGSFAFRFFNQIIVG